MATTDEIFEKWAKRLREISKMDGEARDTAWVTETLQMNQEDPALIVHQDNCVDGCCPGDWLLSRIVYPKLSPSAVVGMFPELIKLANCRTHKAVIMDGDD